MNSAFEKSFHMSQCITYVVACNKIVPEHLFHYISFETNICLILAHCEYGKKEVQNILAFQAFIYNEIKAQVRSYYRQPHK